MSRAFSKILILVIFVILAGGGIFAWQYFGAPEEGVEDETADWETYQDEQNKWYEVKYPPNWTVQSRTVGLGSTITFYDSGTPVFKIWTAPNRDGFVAEEWWDEKDRQVLKWNKKHVSI